MLLNSKKLVVDKIEKSILSNIDIYYRTETTFKAIIERLITQLGGYIGGTYVSISVTKRFNEIFNLSYNNNGDIIEYDIFSYLSEKSGFSITSKEMETLDFKDISDKYLIKENVLLSTLVSLYLTKLFINKKYEECEKFIINVYTKINNTASNFSNGWQGSLNRKEIIILPLIEICALKALKNSNFSPQYLSSRIKNFSTSLMTADIETQDELFKCKYFSSRYSKIRNNIYVTSRCAPASSLHFREKELINEMLTSESAVEAFLSSSSFYTSSYYTRMLTQEDSERILTAFKRYLKNKYAFTKKHSDIKRDLVSMMKLINGIKYLENITILDLIDDLPQKLQDAALLVELSNY